MLATAAAAAADFILGDTRIDPNRVILIILNEIVLGSAGKM
jgi:hypothetical protein